MSIIEKALDKLKKGDNSTKPATQQHDTSLEITAAEEKQDLDSIKKQPNIEAEKEKPLTEKKPIEAAKDVTPKPTPSAPLPPSRPKFHDDRVPDLEILPLNIEGILTPGSARSRLAEEMRMIKRPLLQNAFNSKNSPSDHSNLLMITSALAGEGKTFSSLNLALSIADELDRTVLLVDSDLIKPGLSTLLNITKKPGLADYLHEEKRDIGELLLRTDIPKLTILPAGTRFTRSAELLASNHMKNLFQELATRYPDRLVIFDSPPLLVTSESSVIADFVNQIVIVVEATKTPQHLVKDALGLLNSTENVSLILNKCKQGFLSTKMGGYDYGYGYGDKK